MELNNVLHIIYSFIIFGIAGKKLYSLSKNEEFLKKCKPEILLRALSILCIGIAVSNIPIFIGVLLDIQELALIALGIMGIAIFYIWKIFSETNDS